MPSRACIVASVVVQLPGMPRLLAVDVHRVRQFQFGGGLGDALDDLPRRDVEVIDDFVQAVDVAPLLLLPNLDAAGIDQLGGIALGGAEQPGDKRPQPLGLAVVDRPHDVMVVAHQDVKALVEAGRVGEFLVGVPGGQRRNGGVESRGVAQAGILVARGERAGHAAHGAAAGYRRAADRLRPCAFPRAASCGPR